MPDWLISLLSVIVGAGIGIGGAELVQWWKRPKLEIDFEEKEGKKPYIPDYNDESMHSAGDTYRIKYLRLIVRNKGRKPAMGCEAKLELFPDGAQHATAKVALHWSRHDPKLYSKYEEGILVSQDREKVFAPISLNIDDEETVDVFKLPYFFSTIPDTDHTPRFLKIIESASFRQLQLQPKTTYQCKVTIYSSNANPKAFKFRCKWDGTIEGFNKAFTKD